MSGKNELNENIKKENQLMFEELRSEHTREVTEIQNTVN
jgi:hypothetical protein